MQAETTHCLEISSRDCNLEPQYVTISASESRFSLAMNITIKVNGKTIRKRRQFARLAEALGDELDAALLVIADTVKDATGLISDQLGDLLMWVTEDARWNTGYAVIEIK